MKCHRVVQLTLVMLALLALLACGNDNPPGGTAPAVDGGATSDGADGGPGDVSAADAGSPDAAVGVDAATAPDAPARNPACDKFDDGTYGKKVPWQGFTHKGKTYTCNTCRGGYPNLVGGWRLVDFDTEDPTVDMNGYKERLSFDGNTFEMRMSGEDLGKQVEAVATGWYFCTDGIELSNQRSIFIFDKVEPDGAFGWKGGAITSAETLTQGTNKLAFGFSDEFEGKLPGYSTYCKVGSTVSGKACDDPFK